MSKNATHTQCHLRKGNVTQVSWIPTEHAVVGKYVKLKETKLNDRGLAEDVWEDGWLVVTSGGTTFPSKYIQERGRDWKETRKASDI